MSKRKTFQGFFDVAIKILCNFVVLKYKIIIYSFDLVFVQEHMRKIMKSLNRFVLVLVCMLLGLSFRSLACTSMLVSAKASGTGRPLMWKHRDTGTEHNFIDKVQARDGKMGYVALFNGGDANLREAWMGMNDAGFAIMNTASYNLAPDTARLKDLEGILMSAALVSCRTVEDFETVLKSLKRPIGIQANFGVMDALGNLAYFEANDHTYTRFDVDDTEEGYLIRTNYSESGAKGGGYGYIRELNLRNILADEMAQGTLRPESFTEKASRSFYHAVFNKDFAVDSTQEWVVDQDFIPREISSASIVIEGVNPGENISDMIMWTVLGYPPCSFMVPVTLKAIPENLRPTAKGYRSPFCNSILELKHEVFPLVRGNGKHYINMKTLRPIMEICRKKSLENYSKIYRAREKAEK